MDERLTPQSPSLRQRLRTVEKVVTLVADLDPGLREYVMQRLAEQECRTTSVARAWRESEGAA